MRCFLIVLLLVGLLGAVDVHADLVKEMLPMKRFYLKEPHVLRIENLTATARYAQALTHLPPTRRSTARRQEVSVSVVVPTSGLLSVSNLATGSSLGDLAINSGLTLSTNGFAALSTDASSTWTSRDQRRITISGLSSTFPYLGLTQFSATTGLVIGPGLSNGLLLTGIASPGTVPGNFPTYLDTYANGPSGTLTGSETDIWTIDYTSGALSATWVNPDQTTPATVKVIFITDGTKIAATGDVSLFNDANGPGWVPITLSYLFSS